MGEIPTYQEKLPTTVHSVVPEKPLTPEIVRDGVAITITHHTPDYPQYDWLSLIDGGGFDVMCEKLARDGVTTQRFDARWEKIQPTIDSPMDEAYIQRAVRIAELGKNHGLDHILILSSPPEWAKDLAKNHPQIFTDFFDSYVEKVFSAMAKGGQQPTEVQLFNELNMKNFTPEALMPNLESCIKIVREKMQIHFGKRLPLVATLQVSSIGSAGEIPTFKDDASQFIQKHQELLAQFDGIKLDYYPGIWHLPWKTIVRVLKHPSFLIKTFQKESGTNSIQHLRTPLDIFRTFGDMRLLEQTFTDLKPLAERGVQLGIGEIGIPSFAKLETDAKKPEHQKLQTLGMRIVSDRIQPFIAKYNLTEVGLYSLMDEPVPEAGIFDWGLFDKNGLPKHAAGDLQTMISRITRKKTSSVTM